MPVEILSESVELQYGATIQFFNELYLGLSSLGSPCFYQIMACLGVLLALLIGAGFLVRASVVFALFYVTSMPVEVLWPSGAMTQLPFVMAYGIERFGEYSDVKSLIVSVAAIFGAMMVLPYPRSSTDDFSEEDKLLESQIKNNSDDFKHFPVVKGEV